VFDWSVAYVSSLAYLVLMGSIAAFGSFLALLEREGSSKTGYVGVMVPIVAITISSIFESYTLSWLGGLGIALAVIGNVLTLRKD
jgi:drug/metabolite transporter (DMT)-like permease